MSLVLEIVGATAAHTLIGTLWYAPFAFGKVWGSIVYPTKKDQKRMKEGMQRGLISGVLSAVLLSIAISILSRVLSITSVEQAIGLSLVLGGALVSLIIQRVGYAQDDSRLVLIDGGFEIVVVTVMTLVILFI